MFERRKSHGSSGPLGDRVRLVEEADRGRDARKLVAADAEPEENLGAVEIRERLVLGDGSRAREQVERLAQLALVHPCPGLAGEETGLELGGPGRGDFRTDLLELGDGLLVAVRLDERLGARQRRLDAAALVGRDAVRQVAGVDVEAAREPRDRLAGRARLAALDLADVLLREPIARELALCQARGDAQLAHALTEPKGCGTRGLRDGRRGRWATQGRLFHRTVKRTLHLSASSVRVRSPKRVAITGENRVK